MNLLTILSVGIGGALGAISRYLISTVMNDPNSMKLAFPLSTFLINMVTAF